MAVWVDAPPLMFSATADASGNATALCPSQPTDLLVESVAVAASGSSGLATVKLNDAFVCATSQGWADTADGSPIYIPAGDKLTIEWSQATPGAFCQVHLFVKQDATGVRR